MGEKTIFTEGELYIIDPETGEQQPFSFSQLDEITEFEADSTDKETPTIIKPGEEITLHFKTDKKSFKKIKRLMLRAEIKRLLKYIIALIKWR